jgi:tetratricopeptide (TPR) repeat protein
MLPSSPCVVRVVVLVAVLVGGGRAFAKADDEARRLSADATIAYNLGHYDEAVRLYEECYRAIGDPVLLFNIAQSYRLGGKPEQALRAYRSFLRTAPADAPARMLAERHAAALAQTLSAAPSARRGVPTLRPEAELAAPMPGVDLSRDATPASMPTGFYRRWWFWTAAGAAIVGGAALTYALHDRREDPIAGSAGVVTVR